jgi:hypothetical protein
MVETANNTNFARALVNMIAADAAQKGSAEWALY